MKDYAKFLRAIAALALEARLSNGARALDASDFRQWLVELAEKAEHARLNSSCLKPEQKLREVPHQHPPRQAAALVQTGAYRNIRNCWLVFEITIPKAC